MVSVRDDGWIDLGECRWGKLRSPSGLAHVLADKAERFTNPKNATLGRIAFVKKKPAKLASDGATRWLDLEDLYA